MKTIMQSIQTRHRTCLADRIMPQEHLTGTVLLLCNKVISTMHGVINIKKTGVYNNIDLFLKSLDEFKIPPLASQPSVD